jgi:hypothetical protein
MLKGLKRKPKILRLLSAVVVLACIATTGCAVDRGIVREDSDGRLSLTLTVDKAKCREGESITATVSLKNLTQEHLAVHWLNIEPMYVQTSTELLSGEMSGNWRSAYSRLYILRKTIEWPDISLLSASPLTNPKDAKKRYVGYLGNAKYGSYFPSFFIPAGTTMTVTREFKATKGKDLIDVGLFCRRSFFSSEVLKRSGTGWDGPGEFKYHPKIWTGSLYVSIEVKVE